MQKTHENVPHLTQNLSAGEGGALDVHRTIEGVREVVGTAPEQEHFVGSVTGVLASAGRGWGAFWRRVPREDVLPPYSQQQRQVRRAIRHEQKRLERQIRRFQKSRAFVAHRLELLIARIRELQRILEELTSYAIEQMETLYRRFVLKTM